MFKNKETKKRFSKVALAALLAAAVISSSMAGCSGSKSSSSSSSNSSSDEAPETEVVTRVVNGVYVDENGNIVTDPSGNPATVPATTANTAETKAAGSDNKQQSSAANQGGSSQSSSGSGQASGGNSQSGNGGGQTSSGGNSGNSGSRVQTPSNASQGNTTKKSKKDSSASGLTIGGKTYNVGDTVTCTYFLEAPETLVNFQGRIDFDSDLLSVSSAKLIEPASYGAMINSKLSDHISFNGSDLSGYDFTSPGYEFIVVEYKVKGKGTADPSIQFEVITSLNNKSYSDNSGILSNGAKIWAVYS